MKKTLYVDICYDKKEYKTRKKEEKSDTILQFINISKSRKVKPKIKQKLKLKQKEKEDNPEREEYINLKKNIKKLNRKIEKRIRKIKKGDLRVNVKIVPSNEVIKIVKKLEAIEEIEKVEKNKKIKEIEKNKKIKETDEIKEIEKIKGVSEQNLEENKSKTNTFSIADLVNEIEQSKNIYYENSIEILNNIMKDGKKETKEQSVYLLLEQSSNLNNIKIKEMLNQYKIVYIITDNVKQYRKIEQFAEEEAEMLIILNNRKKSLSKAKYIINYDFSQEDIEKFNINRTATILNVAQNKIKIYQGFQGIVINNIRLKSEKNEKFSIEYEIEKNREKINEKIKNEEYYLIGENGEINKEEIIKLQ